MPFPQTPTYTTSGFSLFLEEIYLQSLFENCFVSGVKGKSWLCLLLVRNQLCGNGNAEFLFSSFPQPFGRGAMRECFRT